MSASEFVHWHEGLFLQPHHLQMMQRRLGEQIASARSTMWPYPYGLVSSQLAPDAVQNRQIRFERLRIIMRSGLEIDVPGNTDLPPLELGKAFDTATAPLTVSIGVPIWYASRANTVDPTSGQNGLAKRIFKISETQVADENTGQNPQPLQLRRVNARLLLENDDREDLEVLPLLRVLNPTMGASGLPRIDPGFYPPCLLIAAWDPLFHLLAELVDRIQATRGKVARDILRDGFDVQALRPGQFQQLFLLLTLSRFSARLPSLVRAPRTTPFDVYLELREMLGELLALRPEDESPDPPDYDHDEPALPFKDLAERIEELIGGTMPTRFVKHDLVREGRAFIARTIPRQELELADLYLSVQTSEDRAKIIDLVQNPIRFKMLPATLVNKVTERGVQLAPDHNPPSALPTGAGLSYFRVMRNDERSEKWWEQIKNEGAVGVTWLGLDLPDVRITLYGIIR